MASSSSSSSSSSPTKTDEKKEFFDKLYSYDRDEDQDPLPQEDLDLSRQFRESRLFPKQRQFLNHHHHQIPLLRHRQTEPITLVPASTSASSRQPSSSFPGVA